MSSGSHFKQILLICQVCPEQIRKNNAQRQDRAPNGSGTQESAQHRCSKGTNQEAQQHQAMGLCLLPFCRGGFSAPEPSGQGRSELAHMIRAEYGGHRNTLRLTERIVPHGAQKTDDHLAGPAGRSLR